MRTAAAASSSRLRPRVPRLALLLATTALTAPGFVVSAAAQNLPTGGSVAAGSASVSQPSSTSLNITQSSQSAVVNWQSFSIGQGYSVNINQPNSSSALLNRVTGNTPSSIAGSLTANGQVYLVNPNGIAITSTGTVNVGGGFVASTLGISDADFMSGKRTFTGNGASAPVSNAGTITVGRGGYAALIGGTVSNSGNIYVPLGKVGLGSGEQATLDFSGDGFMQVAVPTAAKPANNGALIENSGTIKANGGAVIMSAATAREAARNAVNISGVVQARSIGGRTGAIEIGGGDGGKVTVSGKLTTASRKAKGGNITVTGKDIALTAAKLDASGKTGGGNVRVGGDRQGGGTLQHADTVTMDAASSIQADATSNGNGGNVVVWSDVQTNFAGTISAKGGALGGNGGEAEVSGKAKLGYTGFTDLSAANGRFGTLLLDPYNVIISNAADSNQSGFTATGNDSIINVGTLQAALAAANVTVSTGSGGSQTGDITVAAPVTWSSGSTLALNAYHSIVINGAITVNGSGTLGLNATNGGVQVNKTISVTGAGSVNVTSAAQADVSTTGLTFALGSSIDYGATNNGGSFTLNGKSYTLVYSMANFDAIDGVNATNGAAVTMYGAGANDNYALATNLDASGINYSRPLLNFGYAGMLDGLGHSISNMTIGGGLNNNGMIATLSGTLSNFGMVGGSVNANLTGGTLAGSVSGSGVVQTSYSTANIYGSSNVGGLVGQNDGTVQASFAAGQVTAGSQYGGGLVGRSNGTIKNSLASGSVYAGQYTGGLVGTSNGLTTQSLFTGIVSGGGGYLAGIAGSVGFTPPFSTNLYWDTQTSGTSAGKGYDVNSRMTPTGLTTAQLQSGALPSGLPSNIWGAGAGLYPYLKNFYPTGPQVVSGTAYSAGGSALAGASVGAIVNGSTLGTGSTGANGYYYFTFVPGTLSNGASLLTYAGTNAVTLTTSTGAAIQSGVNLYGSVLTAQTSASLLSNVKADATAKAGGNAAAIAAINGTSVYDLTATGASFTIDQAVNTTRFAARTTASGSSLVVASPISISDGGSLTLNSAGTLRINAPVTMKGASTASLGYDATDPANLTFAIGAPLTYTNADGSTAAASAGGTLSINGQSYQLLYTMDDLAGIYNGTGRYALVNSLSPTGSYSDAVVGSFYGTFDGLGHTITGLTITGGGYGGLFGYLTGTVRDIGLIGGSVTGGGLYSGALVGRANNGSVIANAYATTPVVSGTAGGLIGYMSGGLLVNSFATGSTSGGARSGGLVGWAVDSTIRDVFATGAASGVYAGGLIGYGAGGSLINAYATGPANGLYAGGLIGGVNGLALTNVYSDISTTGRGGGGYDLTTAQFQSGGASGLGAAFSGGAGGLYPYLTSFFPNGVQVVSGYVTRQDAGWPLQTTVSVTNGGVVMGSASTGMNGYYYVFAPAGTASNTAGIAVSMSDFSGAITFRTGAVGQLTTDLNLTDGWRRDTAGTLGSLSALNSAFATTVGTTAASSLSIANRQIDSAASTFTLDQALSITGTLALASNGTVTQGVSAPITAGGLLLTGSGSFTLGAGGNQIGTLAANTGGVNLTNTGNLTIGSLTNAVDTTMGGVTTSGGVTVSTDGDLTIAADATISGANPVLSATGLFVNQRGSDAVTATSGRWLIYSSDPTADTFGGLDSGNTATFGSTFATLAPGSVPQSGNRYIFSATRTLTVTSTDASKTYGDDASSAIAGKYLITGYDPGVTGAYLGDTAATAFSGTASITSTGAAATANVAGSPYVMTGALGTLTSQSGYTFSFVNDGRLTVNQRAITVTADAQSKVYGNADPTLSYTVGGLGLANGDTLAGLLGRATGENVVPGGYAITQGGVTSASNPNYAITYTGNTLTITPRAITVTANAQSKVYGSSDPTLGYTVGGDGLVGGDTLAGALTRAAGENVVPGGYAIGQGGITNTNNPNYAISYTGNTFTINPATLTITPTSGQHKTYGDADPTFGYAATGQVVNAALGIDDSGLTLTGALGRVAGETVVGGPYGYTLNTLSAGGNYTLVMATSPSTFAINPATLTYVADTATRPYGNVNPPLSGSVTGYVNGESAATALSGSLTFTTGATGTSGVGSYDITGSGLTANNGNYVFVQASGNASALTVTPRTITVSADAQSKIYGNADPTLSYTVGGLGLANGDTLSGLLGRATGENVTPGGYAITQGGVTSANNPNYAITYTGNTLTITPRAITVTANAQSKIYGSSDPTLGYTVGGDGLVGGDTLTGALTRAVGENVIPGGYAIGQGGITNTNNPNYAISYTGNTFTINPATLTIAPTSGQSKTYGQADPTFGYVASGQVVNPTLGIDDSGLGLTGALGRAAGENVAGGPYGYTLNTLSAGANYTLVMATNPASFAITPATLTITPTSGQSKTYGQADPTFGYVASGQVVNPTLGIDDSGLALTGVLGRAAGENVAGGPYGYTLNTLSASANYTLVMANNPSSFAITPATLTYTANTGTRQYGDANPAMSGTVTGYVNGESAATALTGTLTFSSGAIGASGVGTYDITGSGLTANNGNYVFVQAAGNATALSITPRTITVTADAQIKVYGSADPTLGYTVGGNGLVNGDTLSGALTRAAGENVIAGGYAIGQGGVTDANNPNYAITYTGNTLTITPATLTYVANTATRQYGDTNPALSGTVTGYVNGDTQLTATTGTVTFTTGASGTSGVGSYDITGSGLTLNNANYVFAQATGNSTALSVTPRAITVTADAQTRTYGDANPTLSYAVGGRGLVNGDTLSGDLASSANTTSNVGGYAITQGSLAASSNYALTYTGATLTVTPRAITVTADAKSRVYGDTNPAFTYTLGGMGLVNGDTLSGGLASSANATSNVGGYAITQGSLAASTNYALTYTGATLTVTPRTITVTATDPGSRYYGDANPVFGYTVGGMGLANGDTLSGSLASVANATSNVGNYAITQGSLAASTNYALTSFTGATLTVTQRPITVTADAKTKFGGDANPALTYQIGGSGLVNGDTLPGVLATAADTNSPVGGYAITQGTVAAPSANYLLTYVGANLTVQPRATSDSYATVVDRVLAGNATPIALPAGATAIQGAPQIATANGVATFYADPRSDRALVCFGNVCFAAL